MDNSDRLLDIITELDTFAVKLAVDGNDGYAAAVRAAVIDLMWVYKDLSEYEE